MLIYSSARVLVLFRALLSGERFELAFDEGDDCRFALRLIIIMNDEFQDYLDSYDCYCSIYCTRSY